MERSLRIQGLVRLAQRVRRELGQPITAGRQAQLRQLVTDSLTQVQGILAVHRTAIERLPTPTRRAYQFLASLKLDSAMAQTTGADARPSGDVTLVGLKAFWDRALDGLPRAAAPSERDALHRSIAAASENIERHLRSQGFAADRLTATSRTIRGWLAYFAARDNFDAYVAALARARPVLDAALPRQTRFKPPAVVHFRALPGLYRLRG